MFESLDDPNGTPLDSSTRPRVDAIVRRRRRQRRVGLAALLVAALAVPAGVVLAQSRDNDQAVNVTSTPDDTVAFDVEPVAPTTELEVLTPPSLPLPTSTTAKPTTTTTTTAPPTTTTTAAPPAPGAPTLAGEWTLRAPLQPDPNYGPNVKGEAGARRVAGTQYRWTAAFTASGLQPNSSGHFLVSHESKDGSGAAPFASTACRYTADAEGRATCTGEFDTYEYTNDPNRELRWATVMGPSGNAVASARLS